MIIELQFAECVVRVNHADRYIETIFRDGTIAPARPNWEIMDVARAHDLGYDGDCWEMCLDHEVLHTLVGELTGHGRSVILWNVAHGGGKRWPEGGREEEGYVMSLQRYLRRGIRDELIEKLQVYCEAEWATPNYLLWLVRGLSAAVRDEQAAERPIILQRWMIGLSK